MISWGLSLIFFVTMLITKPIHQNFWFIPTFLIAFISYIILAGLMGAKRKYPEKESEELEYEKMLQEYVNEQPLDTERKNPSFISKVFTSVSYVTLAVMLLVGIVYGSGNMSVETMKNGEFLLTIVYFGCSIAAFLAESVSEKKENKEQGTTVGIIGETDVMS